MNIIYVEVSRIVDILQSLNQDKAAPRGKSLSIRPDCLRSSLGAKLLYKPIFSSRSLTHSLTPPHALTHLLTPSATQGCNCFFLFRP